MNGSMSPMLLLTEATLFFLYLGKSYPEIPLDERVKSWIANVTEADNTSDNEVASSTMLNSGINPPKARSTLISAQTTTAHTSNQDAGDIFAVHNAREKLATIRGVGVKTAQTVRIDTVAMESDLGMDRSPFTQRASSAVARTPFEVTAIVGGDNSMMDGTPFTQRTPSSSKRVLQDIIASGSEPDADEDGIKFIDAPTFAIGQNYYGAGHRIPHITSLGSIGIKTKGVGMPPLKKVKTASVPYKAGSSNTRGSVAQQPALGHPYDEDGYAIRKRLEYTNKDLPVPTDERWSSIFISTAILWYSTQENVWNILDEELVAALQLIFNTVYPGVKYRVTTTGSVFSITLRHLSEWRNSFGSTALAMMTNFFSSLEPDTDICSTAKYLLSDFRLLREDIDSLEAPGMYHSPFLIELIAKTHLNNITAYVNVPGLDINETVVGCNGEGVIALAATALERAITFVSEGYADVEQENGMDGKPTSELPKIPNKQTGLETTAPFQFSPAKWSDYTLAYRESVLSRGPAFVRGIFSQARTCKTATGEAFPGIEEFNAVDPRSLLCSRNLHHIIY